MIEETIKFYNQESEQYSRRRYEGKLATYFQFLFRRRLRLAEALLESVIVGRKGLSLLEIGCADGVVLRRVNDLFPQSFNKMVGIDISPGMIGEAAKRSVGRNISYWVRGSEPQEQYDIVLELGVHPFNLEKEVETVASNLKSGGYFLYSLAGRHSIHARLKLKDKDYYIDYKSYQEYEAAFKKHFNILSQAAYGLFVPKLWALPLVARFVQPIVEVLLRRLAPDLFHEQIYLLQKKG